MDGNLRIMCGPKKPTVINRAWSRMDVKVQLMTAEAGRRAVVRGLVYYGMRRRIHMVVGDIGPSVPKLGIPVGATTRVNGKRLRTTSVTSVGPVRGVRYGGPHLGACFRYGRTGHWKNQCSNNPGVVNRGCFTCGLGDTIVELAPKRL